MQLYPILKNAAEVNKSLNRTLDTFASEMDKITTNALDFFDKYSEGGSGIEFAIDFGRLFGILKNRVYREENVLYQEFDKLSN